jgi:hypothetical protein
MWHEGGDEEYVQNFGLGTSRGGTMSDPRIRVDGKVTLKEI